MIYNYGETQWNDIDRINLRKTCPSAILSTTNPTWTDPGANPGLHSERPVTNHLNHGMALNSRLIEQFIDETTY
jgi:hypothetical protein